MEGVGVQWTVSSFRFQVSSFRLEVSGFKFQVVEREKKRSSAGGARRGS